MKTRAAAKDQSSLPLVASRQLAASYQIRDQKEEQ